jgi:hypothetical protein
MIGFGWCGLMIDFVAGALCRFETLFALRGTRGARGRRVGGDVW